MVANCSSWLHKQNSHSVFLNFDLCTKASKVYFIQSVDFHLSSISLAKIRN